MLMPSIFGENLFDDFMDDFMNDFAFSRRVPAAFSKTGTDMMKTDVKETDTGYELDMNLPGFKKEDVKIQLKDGYLTIQATTNTNQDEKNKEGKYIRKERYSGSMNRSFYIGDTISEDDIHAKFEDGILKLTIPKEEPKKVEEGKYISIEG